MRHQRAKGGERGRVGGGGRGDLTQPPSNFSKFLGRIHFAFSHDGIIFHN